MTVIHTYLKRNSFSLITEPFVPLIIIACLGTITKSRPVILLGNNSYSHPSHSLASLQPSHSNLSHFQKPSISNASHSLQSSYFNESHTHKPSFINASHSIKPSHLNASHSLQAAYSDASQSHKPSYSNTIHTLSTLRSVLSPQVTINPVTSDITSLETKTKTIVKPSLSVLESKDFKKPTFLAQSINRPAPISKGNLSKSSRIKLKVTKTKRACMPQNKSSKTFFKPSSGSETSIDKLDTKAPPIRTNLGPTESEICKQSCNFTG